MHITRYATEQPQVKAVEKSSPACEHHFEAVQWCNVRTRTFLILPYSPFLVFQLRAVMWRARGKLRGVRTPEIGRRQRLSLHISYSKPSPLARSFVQATGKAEADSPSEAW